MPFVPFAARFSELASKEVKIASIRDENDLLPKGDYFFWDSYCDELGCDCRRAVINVYSGDNKRWLACISYGWEPRDFYRQWGHGAFDEADIDELKGPSLMRLQPQSRLAPVLLDMFKELVLPSPGYVERIQRHYRMFREDVEKSPPESAKPAGTAPAKAPAPLPPREPSRNAPCPCGSGRKYKKCCMRHERAESRESAPPPASLPAGAGEVGTETGSFAPSTPQAVDEVRLERLRRSATKRCKVWEADLFGAPVFIKGAPGEPPYAPPMALVVDRESGYILAADISDPVPDLAQAAPQLVEAFLKGAEQIGALPEAIAIEREELAGAFRPVAERLGVEVEVARSLPELNRARRAMFEHFGR
jgi:hypothetical protein